MKKIRRIVLAGLAILAVVLFAACPDPDEKDPTYTFSLNVDDVTMSMSKDAQQVDLKPVVTTKPKGGTIPNGAFSISCVTCPTCDLTVTSGGILTIPGGFGPGDQGSKEYTITLIWTVGGIGAPLQKEFKLTITRGAIEVDSIVVQNMALYRKGATDAQRTIDFILYDTLGLPITSDTYRNNVTLAVNNAGGLNITNTAGKLVVAGDPALALDAQYKVAVTASYNGTPKGAQQEITVTVAALLYEVKFFRSATAEISAFLQSVEAGDPAVKPESPNLSGFEFQGDDWYTDSAATAVYNFSTPVTGPLSLYGKYIVVSATWNANFTITLANDPKAEVYEGEAVYIRDTTGDWYETALSKQTDGTWTGTLQISKAVSTFRYQILVVLGGNVASGFKAQENDFVFNYNSSMGDDVAIAFTVTEWLRPAMEVGELLKKNMMQTDNWQLAGLFPEWTFDNMRRTEVYMTADGNQTALQGPGPRAPNTQYFRFSHRESAMPDANYWEPGATALITQAVNAAEGGLAAGDKVTLYVWVCKYNDSVDKVELVIGAQKYNVPLAQLPTGVNWRQVTFVATLAAADIVEGAVNVGISVVTKAGDPLPRCQFSIDSFSFRKGEFGTTGVALAYSLTVPNITMSAGETKTISYTLTASDESSTSAIPVTYECTTCASCVLTISGNNVTAPAGAAEAVHDFTATATLAGKAVAAAGFTVTVGAPVTHYNLPVEVTVNAEVFDGEVVYIAGSFYGTNWGNSTPSGVIKLAKGADNKWTATVPNIPIARPDILYNIYIGDDASMGWSIRAFDAADGVSFTNAPTVGKLTVTVTEWLGRPIINKGNMLLENSFEEGATGTWALSLLKAWKFEGLLPDLGSAWLKGDGQFGAYFSDNGWYGGGNNSLVGAGGTLKITQDVPAAENQLANGSSVVLSVWINQSVPGQSGVKLLVGAQEFDVTSTLTGAAGWQVLSHTFTLTGADIVGDKIKAGLQYTVDAAAAITFVDEFIFVKAR